MDEKAVGQILVKTGLLEQAANSSSEGITISDVTLPDQPLIFVNQGFERLTGYERSAVIGRNCRFLQGPETNRSTVELLRNAIAKGEACTVELLNYTKEGKPFWNRLSITPVKDSKGQITHYVGIQSDVTLLKRTKERLEKANLSLRHFRKRILNELDQARVAQQFLLPERWPSTKTLQFAAKMVPMEQIGGDFYDVVDLDENSYGMLVADVTGHGIPAALLTFMTSITFKNVASPGLSAGGTIAEVNRRLYGKMPNDAFVTMFYAIYDEATRVLNFCQAGHPDSYVFRSSSREVISLSTGGTIVGAFADDEVVFEEDSIILQPGDRLILYTDAIFDAWLQKSGTSTFVDIGSFIREHADLPLSALFEAIYKWGLDLLKTSKYSDDFTLLGFDILENAK